MRNIYLITTNTLDGFFRRKYTYVALFAFLYLFLLHYDGISRYYVNYDVDPLLYQGAFSFAIRDMFKIWQFFTVVLIFLMSPLAIPAEIKQRTLMTVLARPVDRWQFLVGYWLAIQIYVTGFILIMFGLIQVLLLTSPLEAGTQFYFAIARLLVFTCLLNSLGILLGSAANQGLAISGTMALVLLGQCIRYLGHQWHVLTQKILIMIYPIQFDSYLFDDISNSFIQVSLGSYAFYYFVLGENFMYAIVLLLLAIVIFTYRDLSA